MASPNMTVRAGHPDFLDLEWEKSVVDWSTDRLVELPKGISRHEVRFVVYSQGTYVINDADTYQTERAVWQFHWQLQQIYDRAGM